jgi:hypothetical protein
MPRFVKGSDEAKAYMARLRALRMANVIAAPGYADRLRVRTRRARCKSKKLPGACLKVPSCTWGPVGRKCSVRRGRTATGGFSKTARTLHYGTRGGEYYLLKNRKVYT